MLSKDLRHKKTKVVIAFFMAAFYLFVLLGSNFFHTCGAYDPLHNSCDYACNSVGETGKTVDGFQLLSQTQAASLSSLDFCFACYFLSTNYIAFITVFSPLKSQTLIAEPLSNTYQQAFLRLFFSSKQSRAPPGIGNFI